MSDKACVAALFVIVVVVTIVVGSRLDKIEAKIDALEANTKAPTLTEPVFYSTMPSPPHAGQVEGEPGLSRRDSFDRRESIGKGDRP